MRVQFPLFLSRPAGHWIAALASPRWMVLFFLLTAGGSLAVVYELGSATALMAPPFALLIVNLLAALIARPRFRSDLPLLLFHLALIVLVVLMVVARLIYFDGTTSISRGMPFDGTLLTEKRGPLHGGGLDRLDFSNQGFTTAAFREGKYRATYNRVGWVDELGMPRLAEVGGDRPLVIGHYRIYTTSYRGFSPVFEWHPADGAAPQKGVVQLGYRGQETFGQMAAWTLPNAESAWVMLDFLSSAVGDQVAPTDDQADTLEHALVLRLGEERHALRPGEALQRPGGTLVYRELNSWMGYRIIYDPTEPWIIATVFAGIVSLLWFYAKRIFARLPAEEPA